MALGVTDQVRNILKSYYHDKVEQVLLRESPILPALKTMRVEGKEFKFVTPYDGSGAVSANFNKAKALAAETVRNAEFTVTPGKIFAPYSMNADEVQASLSKKGAYMKVAGEKLFTSTYGLRRVLAAAFYGNGYGVVGKMPSSASITTSGTKVTFTDSAIPASLALNSIVRMKSDYKTPDASTNTDAAKIIAIDDSSVTFAAVASDIAVTTSTYLQFDGSVNSDGTPRLPVGLDGWLPVDRTGLSDSFFGVNRSVASDRLAGILVDDSALSAATNTKLATIQKAFMRARNHGLSNENAIIVVNPFDFAKLSDEMELRNRLVAPVSSAGQKEATFGFNKLKAAASTNFAERIFDDPRLHEGMFYILDLDVVQLWSFTNNGFIDNGIQNNEPGKVDIETYSDNEGYANDSSKLIIDDYINVQPGSGSDDGPDVLITLFFTGAFVVTAPGNCAVGLFPAA